MKANEKNRLQAELIELAKHEAEVRQVRRRKALSDGDLLPKITIGTGVTKRKRKTAPSEVPAADARKQRIAKEYWRAMWPLTPSGPDGLTIISDAIRWAEANQGPRQNEAYSHPNWYASRILDEAQYLHLQPDSKQWLDAETNLVRQRDAAANIGALYTEAKFKFEHERNTLLGEKCRTGGDDGRKAQARQAKKNREKVIEKMTTYIAKGESVRNAARLTKTVDKLGKSAETNRRSWYRHIRPRA